MQSNFFVFKLPKGGRVQSVLGDIGNGVMELTLEQVMAMTQGAHIGTNNGNKDGVVCIAPRDI
jgi:hypothetical protein